MEFLVRIKHGNALKHLAQSQSHSKNLRNVSCNGGGGDYYCMEKHLAVLGTERKPVWIDLGEPREKQSEGLLVKEAGAKSFGAMFITLDLILK